MSITRKQSVIEKAEYGIKQVKAINRIKEKKNSAVGHQHSNPLVSGGAKKALNQIKKYVKASINTIGNEEREVLL